MAGHSQVITKIHAICSKILHTMEGPQGHLAREEAILTAEFFSTQFTEKECKRLSQDIHGLINGVMHRGEALVFLIYHLTDHEKSFLDECLPWFLRAIFFPHWAARKDIAVWRFAPFHRVLSNKPNVCSYSGTTVCNSHLLWIAHCEPVRIHVKLIIQCQPHHRDEMHVCIVKCTVSSVINRS